VVGLRDRVARRPLQPVAVNAQAPVGEIHDRDAHAVPATGGVADDLAVDLQERRELRHGLPGDCVDNQLEGRVADRVGRLLGEIGALDEHHIGAGIQQRLDRLRSSHHVERAQAGVLGQSQDISGGCRARTRLRHRRGPPRVLTGLYRCGIVAVGVGQLAVSLTRESPGFAGTLPS